MRYNRDDIKILNNKKYYKSKLYPVIPYSDKDEYIITTVGDRLDLLAYQYYNDTSLWKIIAIANNNIPNDSMHLTPGLQIRIPTNINDIIENFKDLNKNK